MVKEHRDIPAPGVRFGKPDGEGQPGHGDGIDPIGQSLDPVGGQEATGVLILLLLSGQRIPVEHGGITVPEVAWFVILLM